MNPPLARRLLAEYLGSALLAALVIGSGIAAQQLSSDPGLQLLENAAATAAGLFAIILIFGPVSGAHFNPVVSLVDAAFGGLAWRTALAYIPVQIARCITGAVAANAMFELAAISISTNHRASPAHLFAEVIATCGLILVIFSLARSGRLATAPAAVGAYTGAAYWFTSSTSFANPAISIGRIFSDTFAGIAPASAPAFVVAQLVVLKARALARELDDQRLDRVAEALTTLDEPGALNQPREQMPQTLGDGRPELLVGADARQLLRDAERYDLRVGQDPPGVPGPRGQEIVSGAINSDQQAGRGRRPSRPPRSSLAFEHRRLRPAC